MNHERNKIPTHKSFHLRRSSFWLHLATRASWSSSDLSSLSSSQLLLETKSAGGGQREVSGRVLVRLERIFVSEYPCVIGECRRCNLPPEVCKLHRLLHASMPDSRHAISLNARGATCGRSAASRTDFSTHRSPMAEVSISWQAAQTFPSIDAQ